MSFFKRSATFAKFAGVVALSLILSGCVTLKGGGQLAGPEQPFTGVKEIKYATVLNTVARSPQPAFLEEYDPDNCDSACQKQHDVVDALADKYAGKVRFYRVTTSEDEFKSDLEYPVYMIVRSPLQVYATESGVKTVDELSKFIDEALAEMDKN